MEQKIQLGDLNIDIVTDNGTSIYFFKGNIDEKFEQESLSTPFTHRVIFDLENVKGLNSCGIREWIFLVQRFEKKSALIFRGCSVAMIDQFNMIPATLGQAKIESFYAPYHCGKCDVGEVDKLIKYQDHREIIEKSAAPVFCCESCNCELEFDAIADSYFRFGQKKILSQAS